MTLFKYSVEKSLFGVCSHLADKMHISTRSVRMSFIYASFFTFGSPIIFYLIAAFWMNIRRYSREQRTRIWDL